MNGALNVALKYPLWTQMTVLCTFHTRFPKWISASAKRPVFSNLYAREVSNDSNGLSLSFHSGQLTRVNRGESLWQGGWKIVLRDGRLLSAHEHDFFLLRRHDCVQELSKIQAMLQTLIMRWSTEYLWVDEKEREPEEGGGRDQQSSSRHLYARGIRSD